MYKFVAFRYPTVENEFTKLIYIKGVDDQYYLFKFMKLTNGTDVEIDQYKQTVQGQWIPYTIQIN